MKKIFAWLSIFALYPALCFSDPLLKYETFTLKNGLQFILMENKRAPIVSYTTWYKVGSADEVEGKTGLAHYLEHIMETAYPEIQMGQFLEDFNASNIHSNAFTSHDYTYYYRMVTTDHLELVMRFEAGRMKGVAFNQDKFDTEKNVILEERLMRTENDPGELFSQKFNSQFFKVHPYKNPVIGWENDIRNLTLDDAKDFHKKWYHPNNAFIIVSGDFDPAQVKAWAEEYYAPIPGGPRVERNRPQDPNPLGKMAPLIVEHPRATLITFNEIYKLRPRTKENYKDYLALYVLSEYLNGDSEGSLEEIIVHKEKLATSFYTDCTFYHYLDPWSFAIVATTDSEPNLKKIEAIVHERLAQIAKEGLNSHDLALTRKYIYNQGVMNLDDIYRKAQFLGTALAAGLTLEEVDALLQEFEKITSSDIQRVIKAYLSENNGSIGILKQTSTAQSKGLQN